MSPPAVVPGVAVARQSDRQDAGPWARRLATGRSLTTLQVGLALTQHEMAFVRHTGRRGDRSAISAAPFLEIQSIRVDLMFILAFTTPVRAPPEAAIAAWILVLIVDLESQDRLGFTRFSSGWPPG